MNQLCNSLRDCEQVKEFWERVVPLDEASKFFSLGWPYTICGMIEMGLCSNGHHG